MNYIHSWIIEKLKILPKNFEDFSEQMKMEDKIRKTIEDTTKSELENLRQIYENEESLYKKFATNDNYYGDLLGSKTRKVERISAIIEELELISRS